MQVLCSPCKLYLLRLSLECNEDGGLKFAYPGSVLLQDSEVSVSVCHSHLPLMFTQVVNERVLTHHFTLLNPTPTLAEFTLNTRSEKFRVSNIRLKKGPSHDSVSLQSEQSVSVSVSTVHV